MGQIWKKYYDTSLELDSDKQQKIEQDVPNQDSISFEVQDGIDMVIINEDRGNFTPMFLLTTEKILFNQNSGLYHQNQSDGQLDTMISAHYFNADKSHWEPIIERFMFIFHMKQVKKKTIQIIQILEPLNINFSIYLSGVVHDFIKLWEKSHKRSERFQKQI